MQYRCIHQKNVYKIFDMADQLDEYKIPIGKESLSAVLHRIYSELCKTTHTATTCLWSL
jgi:hypothetical protein